MVTPEDATPTGPFRTCLPVPVGTAAIRRAAPGRPVAAFLSQLIAERDGLPPQRSRRRAPLGLALDCYGMAARQAIPRLPPGYRTTLTV